MKEGGRGGEKEEKRKRENSVWGSGAAIECLISMYKALSSIPSTARKEGRKGHLASLGYKPYRCGSQTSHTVSPLGVKSISRLPGVTL